jgi:glycogen(starch) synthase
MAGRARLLLVGDYPPPWGGIAVHVRALLELSLREGFDARVLDVGGGRRTQRHPRVIPAAAGPSFAAGLAAAAGSGTLVHAHVSGNNGKAWLVALAAGRARRPGGPGTILTVHSGLVPAFLATAASRRRLVRAACSGYSRVLAVNGAIGRALEEAGVPGGKLAVVPAAVPAADVSAPGAPTVGAGTPGAAVGPVPAPAVQARRRHRPLLVAALAPGAQYGEDVLLDALGRLVPSFPEVGLLAFGPGTGEAWAAHARAGLGGRVTGLGELDHPAALATLALADAFVRPTRADGDSLSVREALGLGVRVVASDVGHRPAGVVRFGAGDAAALAAGVREALAAPPPRAPALDVSPSILGIWRSVLPGARPPARERERGEA